MGMPIIPSVGRIVHYIPTYGAKPVAAIITDVTGPPGDTSAACTLCLFTPVPTQVYGIGQGDESAAYSHWRVPPRVDAF